MAQERFLLRSRNDPGRRVVVRRRPVVVPRRDRNGERREPTLSLFRFPSIACRVLHSPSVLSFRQRCRENSTCCLSRRRRLSGRNEDRASGRRDHRPGLDGCLKALHPGNTFVVSNLDRLGRELKHLVSTVGELRGRGVGLRVLAGADAETDATTANGRLVFGIFAAVAEFEGELIAGRTRAGLAAARARGRRGGRPRKMDRAMLRMAMSAMASRETNARDLARRLGITTTTLYMYVNGDGTVKAPGQKLLDAVST